MFHTQQDEISDDLKNRVRKIGYSETLKLLLGFIVRRAEEIKLGEVASTMALATFLGIVPVLAISVAVFAAFPQFTDARLALEQTIVNLLPDQHSELIIRYLKHFTTQASGLTTFGFVGLIFTVGLLLNKLFRILNQIFKVESPRPLFQRICIYWLLITLGPVFLVLSSSITGYFIGIAVSGVEVGISKIVLTVIQVLIPTLVFACVYKLIPNCHVRFRYAFMGAFLVCSINQTVKSIFGIYVTSGSLSNIYGVFTAIPVLILWIYLSWYLFFIGAAITATIPQLMAARLADRTRVGNDFVTAMTMLISLVRLRLEHKAPKMTLMDLCRASDTDPEYAAPILTRMEKTGYVVAMKNGRESSFALIADPEKDTMENLFDAFVISSENTLLKSGRGEPARWFERLKVSEALTLPLMHFVKKG